MARDADHTLSSIALLQERFRQLQRIKELRQERELMRLTTSLSDSESRRSASFSGGARPSPPPARPHCQLALSLWPDSQTKGAAKSYKSPAPFNLETSHTEIDTSLRL